jgi:hypothetical protein
MSPERVSCGSVRSSAMVNELIRALVRRRGGWLNGADRAEYEQLRDEWVQAVARERDPPRIEIVEAA